MATSTHHRLITTQIHQVHIADGFADDCEELIHRWLKTDMLTYETFCEIWKDMQFDLLFHGRPTGAEMGELSEELIHIAKHYMVSNTEHFEEAVAGLFLVYALLNLQPYPGFASLRIVPDDVQAIIRIETVARASRRYDVLYILGSILTQGPVQYQAVARERGMEASFRKYLDGTTGIDRVGVRPKGVFYRQNEELDLLRELNNITRRYVEAKRNIPGSSQSLNYTNEKLATELDSSLKGIINGILEEGDEGNQKISEHYSTVQAIKEKAMRQSVDSVKFLSSSTERNEASKPSEITSKVDKKPPSPKKAVSRKNPRCTVRAHRYRNRNRKRRRRTRYSSSSSSESLDLTSSDSQDENDDPQNSHGNSDDDGIEVITDLDVEDLNGKSHAKHKEAENKNIDIAIEKLPVLIRTEQDGNLFEIEIIDEMVKKSPYTTEVDKTKLNDKVTSEEANSKDVAQISKIPEDNKKEKRKLRKPSINVRPLEMPTIDDFNENTQGSSKKASNKK